MSASPSNPTLDAFFKMLDTETLTPPSSDPQIFKGASIPVTYALELPIPITSTGSTVRYAFNTEEADIGFGIVVQGENGKGGEEGGEREIIPVERMDSHLSPITGSIRCPPPPCTLVLCWDNHYSWFSSKSLSYSVTLIPPSTKIQEDTRKKKLEVMVQNGNIDLVAARARLDKVKANKADMERRIREMEEEVGRTRETLGKADEEEGFLRDRVEFRVRQIKGLNKRIRGGEKKEGEIGGDENMGEM